MVRLKKIYNLLIAMFLVTSPMYWFIGIPTSIFIILKYGILAVLFCISIYVYSFKNTRFQRDELYPVLFMIINVTILFFLYANNELIDYILVVYPFIYFAVLCFMFKSFFSCIHSKNDIVRLMDFVNNSVIFITLIIVVYATFNIEIGSRGLPGSIASGGFAVLRTTWSGAISLFISANLYFIMRGVILPSKKIWLLIILIIYCQYISGGRGGLLSSIFQMLLYLYYLRKLKYLTIIVVMFSLFNFSELINTIIGHLRLDRGIDGPHGGVSAGRLIQYEEGISMLLENSLIPLGYNGYLERFNDMGINHNIHNVFINFFVQYGLLFILVFFYFLFVNIKKSGNFFSKSILWLSLIPTIFEPSAIFVNVNAYLIWWFIFYFNSTNVTLENKSI